jgi:hypothetical protein
MDNKENIPYIVYEATQARSERTIKKLTIALVISIILMFATNAIWLYAWCQYDYSSDETVTTVEQDSKDGGNANYIGKNGDINNGLSESNSNTESKKTN